MVSAADLDTILARFEAAVVACVTPADVTNVRLDLHRAIGTAGRTDAAAVAMIDGAVVPKKLWDAYAPRFTALLAALDARGHNLHAAERAKLERRRVATLRLGRHQDSPTTISNRQPASCGKRLTVTTPRRVSST